MKPTALSPRWIKKPIRKILDSPTLLSPVRALPEWVKNPTKKILGWPSATVKRKAKRPGPLWNVYTNRLPLQSLINQLSEADVVSFDVFDTLVLRPFVDPKDVFSLIEVQLNRPGFRNHRIRAEKEARAESLEKSGGESYEVSLRDIYEKFDFVDGIDIEQGMEVEMQVELKYVRPNPYMVDALYAVVALGKRVVFVSDMYMSSDQIRLLLSAAEINVEAPIFVSSEHGVSKRHGGLYDIVTAHFDSEAEGLEYIHIGDNWTPDVEMPTTRGWKSVYYDNVHARHGAPWVKHGDVIRSHATQGLVDVRFGNVDVGLGATGLNYYSLGYRYSGPIVLAFAQWIARRAEEKGLDQVVFLARDGYLPYCVFQLIAPTISSCYLPWSRAVGLTGAAKNFKGEWIRQFVNRAGEAGYGTVAEFLAGVKVQLDPELMAAYGLNSESSLLDEDAGGAAENSQALQRLFAEHWPAILIQIEQSSREILEAVNGYVTGTKIGVVDLGWAGTGTFTLRSMLSDQEVHGFQFGSFRQQRFAPLIEDGVIENFAFGADKNFQYRNLHARNSLVNSTLLEILLGAPHPSVASLSVSSTSPMVQLREASPDEDHATRLLVMGALDFTTDYLKTFSEAPVLKGMSGGTAAALYAQLLGEQDVVSQLLADFPSKMSAAPHHVRKQ